MAREKTDYRTTLELLQTMYPGKMTLTIAEACEVCGRCRKTLLKDRAFPARLVGGKYAINITALARYMS